MGQLEKFETHQMYSGIDCRVKEVISIGFEPMTYSLEGCRSIQLSYETLNRKSVAKIIFFSLQPSSQPEKNGSKYCPGVETGFKRGI
jgi:hypothetical protein